MRSSIACLIGGVDELVWKIRISTEGRASGEWERRSTQRQLVKI